MFISSLLHNNKYAFKKFIIILALAFLVVNANKIKRNVNLKLKGIKSPKSENDIIKNDKKQPNNSHRSVADDEFDLIRSNAKVKEVHHEKIFSLNNGIKKVSQNNNGNAVNYNNGQKQQQQQNYSPPYSLYGDNDDIKENYPEKVFSLNNGIKKVSQNNNGNAVNYNNGQKQQSQQNYSPPYSLYDDNDNNANAVHPEKVFSIDNGNKKVTQTNNGNAVNYNNGQKQQSQQNYSPPYSLYDDNDNNANAVHPEKVFSIDKGNKKITQTNNGNPVNYNNGQKQQSQQNYSPPYSLHDDDNDAKENYHEKVFSLDKGEKKINQNNNYNKNVNYNNGQKQQSQQNNSPPYSLHDDNDDSSNGIHPEKVFSLNNNANKVNQNNNLNKNVNYNNNQKQQTQQNNSPPYSLHDDNDNSATKYYPEKVFSIDKGEKTVNQNNYLNKSVNYNNNSQKQQNQNYNSSPYSISDNNNNNINKVYPEKSFNLNNNSNNSKVNTYANLNKNINYSDNQKQQQQQNFNSRPYTLNNEKTSTTSNKINGYNYSILNNNNNKSVTNYNSGKYHLINKSSNSGENNIEDPSLNNEDETLNNMSRNYINNNNDNNNGNSNFSPKVNIVNNNTEEDDENFKILKTKHKAKLVTTHERGQDTNYSKKVKLIQTSASSNSNNSDNNDNNNNNNNETNSEANIDSEENTSPNNSSNNEHTKRNIEMIMEDVKMLKRNDYEYIDVQFIESQDKDDKLRPVYIKKNFSSSNDDNNKIKRNNNNNSTDTFEEKKVTNNSKNKIQQRRELITNRTLQKMNQKQKRQLMMNVTNRNYSSKRIESNYLIFDFFCDYDISEEKCKNVEETLKKCSQYIQKMITIEKTLYITVDFYSFCSKSDCANKSATVASSSPSSLFLLSDANGVEWTFPKALFKQIHYTSDLDSDEEDIYVQINNNFEFYFGDSDVFNTKYRDLLYILLHEITHGLGFLSFWDTTFAKDYPEIFKENTKEKDTYLLPQGYYSSIVSAKEIQFLGFVPLSIFDRYLMYHEEYAPIYNLYTEIMNSSRKILRKNGNRMFLSDFIKTFENENDPGFMASKFLYTIATGKIGSISFGIPSKEYIDKGFDTEFKYITISDYIPLQSFCDLWSSSSSLSHIDYSYIESSDFLMVYLAKKGKSLKSLINSGVEVDGWDIKEPEDGIYPIWGPDTQHIMKTIGWNVVMEDRQLFSRNITHTSNQCEYFLAVAGATSIPIWIKQISSLFLYITFWILYLYF